MYPTKMVGYVTGAYGVERRCSMKPETMPGEGLDLRKMPGHWILARLGKRVLRPGGWEITRKMLGALAIGPTDRVVEFAPGMGATASRALRRRPADYVGVERDREAAARLRTLLAGRGRRLQQGTAEDTGMPDECATVVYGEAMLTMQPDETKRRIVHEAARLLAPGGRYGIHELTIVPDGVSTRAQGEIRDALTRTIHVGARPLTVADWRRLLEAEGLQVRFEARAPMHLLEFGRLVRDEGVPGTLRILWNALRNPVARRRVLGMRRVFREYRRSIGAVTLVGEKPAYP
jgi:SAM-dependent methyltransferase